MKHLIHLNKLLHLLLFWGADGMVYMWVSKTHAARLESSNLSRPTIKKVDIFFNIFKKAYINGCKYIF